MEENGREEGQRNTNDADETFNYDPHCRGQFQLCGDDIGFVVEEGKNHRCLASVSFM